MVKTMLDLQPLIYELPVDESILLTGILPCTNLPPNTLIFREGELGDRFHIVLEGLVEIVKSIGTEDERSLNVIGPGYYIGEITLLTQSGIRRTATSRTRTEVQLLEMTSEDVEVMLARQPAISIKMIRELNSHQIDSEQTILEELRVLTKKNRELSITNQKLKSAQIELIEKEKLERELELARNIQNSILPHTMPRWDGFDFGAKMVSSHAVGGDLFDFIQLGSGKLGILIGDASGKGVPAAIFMALTRSLIRALASPNKPPSSVLRRVNQLLLEMNTENAFITLLYGILDQNTHEFHYGRAGHEVPLLFTKDSVANKLPLGQGQLIGVFKHPDIDVQSVTLSPMSTLLMYTDGALDAEDSEGTFFGFERLQATVQTNLQCSAQDICDHLLGTLRSFQGTTTLSDDVTLVVIKTQ